MVTVARDQTVSRPFVLHQKKERKNGDNEGQYITLVTEKKRMCNVQRVPSIFKRLSRNESDK